MRQQSCKVRTSLTADFRVRLHVRFVPIAEHTNACVQVLTHSSSTFIPLYCEKKEVGVKLKMQDLRLFNLVFENDPGWILDFSNRTLSAFFDEELNIDIE